MDTIHLATEITESQKVRSDLLKWKIIAIAFISLVGLGISRGYNKTEMALCIIPFVMAYIDALCIHLNLRIFSIGKWHTTEKAKELEVSPESLYMQEYENYIEFAYEAGAFNLEKWTIFYSSLFINVIIIIYPFIDKANNLSSFQYALITSGVLGLILSITLDKYMRVTKDKIKNINYPNVNDRSCI